MNLSSRPPLQVGERQELSTDADFAPTENGVLSCFAYTYKVVHLRNPMVLILSARSAFINSACRLPHSLQ